MKLPVTTLAVIMLGACTFQTFGAPQKLKKVSKPEDGQEWKVTIYEYEGRLQDRAEKLGKEIAKSKFKKNTDGLLTDKLQFDFTNTPYNLIHYGPNGTEYTAIVRKFKQVKNLSATLNTDRNNPIAFTPSVTIIKDEPITQKSEPRSTEQIAIKLPQSSETWTILSGEALTPSKLRTGDIDKYILKKIIVTSNNGDNEKYLPIYSRVPSTIAVQKGKGEFQIKVLKQAEIENLTTIFEKYYIKVATDGSISLAKTASHATTPSVFTQEKRSPAKKATPNLSEEMQNALTLRALLLNITYPGHVHFTRDSSNVRTFIQKHELPENIVDTPYYKSREELLAKEGRQPYKDIMKKEMDAISALQPEYIKFRLGKDNSMAESMLTALFRAAKQYEVDYAYETREDVEDYLKN